MTAQMSSSQPIDINKTDEYEGLMPEVVATASRLSSEDIGMMSEIVVTAPRFEGEDIAYSGMMPEVVVTASRYKDGKTPPIVMSETKQLYEDYKKITF